jgi:hypothetical protein
LAERPEVIPLPVGARPAEVVVTAGPGVTAAMPGAVAADTGGRLVYSNTLGTFVHTLRAGQFIADDLSLTAPPGCNLRRYSFQVSLKADPAGIGGPVTATFALHDTCPQAGGQIVPGTGGAVTFSGGWVDITPLINIIVLIPEGYEVPLPSTVWLAVRFSRDNCGVVLGAPALVGFSDDAYDFPLLNCRAGVGGFPQFPHASFNAEVYVDSACPHAFLGYHNMDPGGPGRSFGANVRYADDIELQGESCNLVGYEIGVKGLASYSVDLRRDRGGLPDEIIAGTGTNFFALTTAAKIQYVPVDPPIQLDGPPNRVWLSVRPNTSNGRWIRTGRDATVGHTDAMVAVETQPGSGRWELRTETDHNDPVYSGYYAALMCEGDPPLGACCDMFLLQCQGGADDGARCGTHAGGCGEGGNCEPVCREVPEMNCPFPPRGFSFEPKWVKGTACDPDPFPLSCGVSACCTPDDTCENLTLNECYALEPVEFDRLWQGGLYCEVGFQDCPFSACLQRQGECLLAHEFPGCRDPYCCESVCAGDPFCCRVEWDRACVDVATGLCAWLTAENDVCAPTDRLEGATLVSVPGSAITPGSLAGTDPSEPGFCCHRGPDRFCMRDNDIPCFSDLDCPLRDCPPPDPRPGAQGYGTVWYRFLATHTSAELTLEFSEFPVTRTLLQVFDVGDPTSPESACHSLTPMACLDGTAGGPHSGADRTSALCVRDLVPGRGYYVAAAAKTEEDLGLYRLTIDAPCAPQRRLVNDTCRNAAPLTGSVAFNLDEAIIECPTSDCGGPLHRDLWFDFVAPEDGTVELSACSPDLIPGQRPWTVIVREGCECDEGARPVVLCGDVGDERCRSNSSVSFEARSGQCYKIRLGARSISAPNGEICVNCRHCPRATVRWDRPILGGFEDMRRPFDPRDPDVLEGIALLGVQASEDADDACWSFCETSLNPDLHPQYPPGMEHNGISFIENADNSEYIIHFKRPLTPGEQTTVTYTDDYGTVSRALFVVHPGEVNGDGVADGNDLLAFADGLRKWCFGPRLCLDGRDYWPFIVDMNRDDRLTAQDLLELVDLLVGAGSYEPWLGSVVPFEPVECP